MASCEKFEAQLTNPKIKRVRRVAPAQVMVQHVHACKADMDLTLNLLKLKTEAEVRGVLATKNSVPTRSATDSPVQQGTRGGMTLFSSQP